MIYVMVQTFSYEITSVRLTLPWTERKLLFGFIFFSLILHYFTIYTVSFVRKHLPSAPFFCLNILIFCSCAAWNISFFLYINGYQKFALLYVASQLRLQLRKGPVEKSSSLKINLQFKIYYSFIPVLYEILAFAMISMLAKY